VVLLLLLLLPLLLLLLLQRCLSVLLQISIVFWTGNHMDGVPILNLILPKELAVI
jgi:hypothetical protein